MDVGGEESPSGGWGGSGKNWGKKLGGHHALGFGIQSPR